MGTTVRKKERGRSLVVAVASVGLLLGSSALAFADSAPSPSVGSSDAGSPSRALESAQALAFQSGYIQATPEPVSGVVLGAREAKQMYGQGDVLYLRLAPTTDAKVGDQFTLFRPITPLYHPITRVYMGRRVAVLGIIEISKPTAEGVTEALIARSYDVMAPGDLLKPYIAPPSPPDQQVTSGPLTGVVLEFQTPRQLVGQSEIAYLDKGAQDGVALGDRFTVSHQGQRLSATSKNPDTVIATITVIAVQAQTSTATVLQSADVIRRGDLINRLPPPAPKTKPSAVPPMEQTSAAIAAAPTAPPVAPSTLSRKELAEVYFAFDHWRLSQESRQTLAEHADYLRQNPTLALALEGHADERGSHEYNARLGEKRAEAVRRFFADSGVTNTLTAISYGKDRPVCAERNEPCYAKNRRVHLTVGH